MPNYVSN